MKKKEREARAREIEEDRTHGREARELLIEHHQRGATITELSTATGVDYVTIMRWLEKEPKYFRASTIAAILSLRFIDPEEHREFFRDKETIDKVYNAYEVARSSGMSHRHIGQVSGWAAGRLHDMFGEGAREKRQYVRRVDVERANRLIEYVERRKREKAGTLRRAHALAGASRAD